MCLLQETMTVRRRVELTMRTSLLRRTALAAKRTMKLILLLRYFALEALEATGFLSSKWRPVTESTPAWMVASPGMNNTVQGVDCTYKWVHESLC